MLEIENRFSFFSPTFFVFRFFFFFGAWSRILIDCHLIFTFYKRSKMAKRSERKRGYKIDDRNKNKTKKEKWNFTQAVVDVAVRFCLNYY